MGQKGGPPTSRPQMVHVVSMLDVPNKLGSTSFQSNDVNGAQKSEFLFCKIKQQHDETLRKYKHLLRSLLCEGLAGASFINIHLSMKLL